MTLDDQQSPLSVLEGADDPFAKRFRELRKQSGESLGKLAAAIGTSKGYVHQLEHGRCTNPSLDVLRRLSEHWHVSIADLIGEPDKGLWRAGFKAGIAAAQKAVGKVKAP